ncbi:GSCFA domain-containing protein [Mameliella alba]|uniref:GSCFA domain-containing protein n=1 Tax=Mameliella alba TaxID=561184 RepID=UPI0012FFCF2E|nr:GSCFA domain-containing protein [Mameliella alba]
MRGKNMSNPYKALPETKFWKKAVSEARENIRPGMKKKFKISKGQKVATAGSCFAQNVAKHLQKNPDINFLTAEPLFEMEPIFSGRYGNIYTAHQLLQIFDECETETVDENCAIKREDGKYVDINRPYICKDGYDTPSAVVAERKKHISAIKDVFKEADIFVFTLGLTEAWKSKDSGRVYPVCPGVYSTDPGFEYEFINYSFSQVKFAMQEFLNRFSNVNREAKVLLTVSPVPLTATYSDDHILVATTHSKSILRAVCSELTEEYNNVFYFPSFEMIANPYTERSSYVTENLREVRTDEIETVMGFFDSEYLNKVDENSETTSHTWQSADNSNTSDAAENDIYCDDVEIEKSMGF